MVRLAAIFTHSLCFVLLLVLHLAMPNPRRHVAADGSVREFDGKVWRLVAGPSNIVVDEGTSPLAIEGRRFEYNFSGGEFTVAGSPIFIMPGPTREAAIQQDGDTGRTVWDGAVVLAKYLENSGEVSRCQGRVLELGAGTGLAGLAAAALGGDVLLTDLGYCLPQLRASVAATAPGLRGSVRVAELDWSRPTPSVVQENFGLVLGADVVWLPHLVAPLVQLLERLLDASPSLAVLLAHQTRSLHTDREFFGALSHKFEVLEVPMPGGMADFSSDRIRIVRCVGRKVSGSASFEL